MIRDCAQAPRVVTIAEGGFTMGANPGDKFANDTERPAHLVRVGPFAMGLFPVTVGEYHAFRTGDTSHDESGLPVVDVSWEDAHAYCDWLSRICGRLYRLPSEAEWEFACRAGSTTPFACGSEITPRDANYLYSETGETVGPGRRTTCGEFPANAWGLHDLHGNVCEWVEDAWRPNYLDAAAPDPARRVIRGGAWDYLPRLLRCAWRDGLPANTRRDNLGFRVATSEIRK